MTSRSVPISTLEPVEQLLTIGVFARRSRLSPKALRLYDRLGLLMPAHVDEENGYRRYREGQLETARLIAMLRRLDMPLASVAEIVDGARGAAGGARRRVLGVGRAAARVAAGARRAPPDPAIRCRRELRHVRDPGTRRPRAARAHRAAARSRARAVRVAARRDRAARRDGAGGRGSRRPRVRRLPRRGQRGQRRPGRGLRAGRGGEAARRPGSSPRTARRTRGSRRRRSSTRRSCPRTTPSRSGSRARDGPSPARRARCTSRTGTRPGPTDEVCDIAFPVS